MVLLDSISKMRYYIIIVLAVLGWLASYTPITNTPEPIVIKTVIMYTEDEQADTLAEFNKLKTEGYSISYDQYRVLKMYNDTFFKLPLDIVVRLIQKESAYKANARSRVGAVGLMQIMPKTFNWIVKREKMNVKIDVWQDNMYVGLWYLDYLHDRVQRAHPTATRRRQWELTLSSYNAGYSRRKHALLKFKETINYVKYILA